MRCSPARRSGACERRIDPTRLWPPAMPDPTLASGDEGIPGQHVGLTEGAIWRNLSAWLGDRDRVPHCPHRLPQGCPGVWG
jgi:hypothetical protein